MPPHHHAGHKLAVVTYRAVATACRLAPKAMLAGGLLLVAPAATKPHPSQLVSPAADHAAAHGWQASLAASTHTSPQDWTPPPDSSLASLGEIATGGLGSGHAKPPSTPPRNSPPWNSPPWSPPPWSAPPVSSPPLEPPPSGAQAVDEASSLALLAAALPLLAWVRRRRRRKPAPPNDAERD